MSEKTLKVSYGPNELEIASGTAPDVATLRKQVYSVLNIPDGALAQVDGVTIQKADEAKAPITPATKEVTFVKESGSKS